MSFTGQIQADIPDLGYWPVLALGAVLVFLAFASIALYGFAYLVVRRQAPTNRFVRAVMALATIMSAVGVWVVVVSMAIDPNSGPVYWSWIWPALVAGAGMFLMYLRKQLMKSHS